MTEADENIRGRRYSTELATQALRRAARLQVDAAEAAERRPAQSEVDDLDGLDHDDLVQAAREAGIDESMLLVALAELDDGRGGTTTLALPDRNKEHAATRWLGTAQRNVLVSRVLEGTPEEVWPALGKVFEADACGLRLQRLSDGHPIRGGVARFAMRSLARMVREHGSYSQLCYRMKQLELRGITVSLRDLDGRTQVNVYGDLRDGVDINLRWARRTGISIGALAGGGSVAAGLSAGLLIAVSAGLLGVIGGVAAVVGLWRFSYRSALANLERELDQLLAEVDDLLHRQTAYQLPEADG